MSSHSSHETLSQIEPELPPQLTVLQLLLLFVVTSTDTEWLTVTDWRVWFGPTTSTDTNQKLLNTSVTNRHSSGLLVLFIKFYYSYWY